MSKTFKAIVALGLILLVTLSLVTAALAAPPVKVAPSGNITSLSVSPTTVVAGGTISVSIGFSGVVDSPNGVHVTVQGPGGGGTNTAAGQAPQFQSPYTSANVTITIPSDANPGAWSVTEVTIQGFNGNAYSPTQLDFTSFPTGSVTAFAVDPPAPPDTIAPTTTATPEAGWYNTDQTVSLTATDNAGGSGVKEIHYSINGGAETVVAGSSASFVLSAEGSYTISYYAVDNAGNAESPNSLTIGIDKTAPTITASATKADSTVYVAGSWTNQDVTVHYTASDTGGSGLASVTADQTFSATTASTSGTATDNAGNSTSVSFGPINIDKIPPTVTITGPAVVLQGTSASATWAASDTGGSGLVGADSGTLPLNTAAAGTYTVTYTAMDNAGNSTTASFTYTVWGVTGPFAPLVKNGQGAGQYKAGSTIPVKFQLTDGTNLITTATGTVTIGSASAPIRWDATAQQYIANVKTGAPGSSVPVVLTVDGLSGSYTLATVTLK